MPPFDDDILTQKKQLILQLLFLCYRDIKTRKSALHDTDSERGWCPRTFDGYLCWEETPPETIVYKNCPEFIIGFGPKRMAVKTCTKNGTWYQRPGTNNSWSNYTNCVDMEDLAFRTIVNDVYVVCYALSVVALLVAIIIFATFRTLRCTRIRIHMNLFASLLLNNLLWIMWYKMVVNSVSVLMENKVWCQAVNVVMNYFMVSSYMWMFSEGLHLNFVTTVVFFTEEISMLRYVLIGWVLPAVIIAAYSVTRYRSGATERCWIEEDSHAERFISVPVALTLIASVGSLFNVVRIILIKLQHPPNQPVHAAFKKAARATFSLIPLFGLHYFLIPLHPSLDSPYEKTYEVFAALLTSLQGLVVSILFCFVNEEVINVVGAYFTRRTNNDIAMTGTPARANAVQIRENIIENIV